MYAEYMPAMSGKIVLCVLVRLKKCNEDNMHAFIGLVNGCSDPQKYLKPVVDDR